MGINAIGSGAFTVENSIIHGRSLINLRPDYGSTWQGEIIIRDCTFAPSGGKLVSVSLINGYNSGLHDFGYPNINNIQTFTCKRLTYCAL
jgi:hypothetical protein